MSSKTQITGFGFEVLITYLLPGILLVAAIALFHGITMDQTKHYVKWVKDAQFFASILFITFTTLSGAIIASIQSAIETFFLDKFTPWKLSISSEEFLSHWYKYLKNLNSIKNSYVSRVVLFFQFETRLGLSAIVLGVSLCRYSKIHSVIFIIVGIGFYFMGMLHHQELAKYRKMQALNNDM